MNVTEAQLKEFLENKKALIVDASNTYRVSIGNTIAEVGVSRSSIIASKNFSIAEGVMQREKPQIIISEYKIGKSYGMNLLEMQRELQTNPNDRIFVLATTDSTESSVAEAAEEDVDSYIIKPFSADIFKEYFTRAVVKKINPSPYDETIRQGKDLMAANDIDHAIELFLKAKALAPKPALACYYAAQVDELKEELEAALKEYNEGLSYNTIHYKCLAGKFDVLERLNKKQEAYQVVQEIVKHFPISPQRLGRVLQLAVFTGNFTDALNYYELFNSLDKKTDELITLVSAGLFVCGKRLIQEKKEDQAYDAFEKAVFSSARNPTLLRRIINTLLETDHPRIAERFLHMFSIEHQQTKVYRQMEFTVANAILEPHKVIEKGRALIKERVATKEIYLAVIDRLIETGRENMAETIAYQGIEDFSQERAVFSEKLDEIQNRLDSTKAVEEKDPDEQAEEPGPAEKPGT
jgi:tetratricopeptide (TPR) repeat protein